MIYQTNMERNFIVIALLLCVFSFRKVASHDFLAKRSVQMRFVYQSSVNPKDCFETYSAYLTKLMSETYLSKLQAICDQKKFYLNFKDFRLAQYSQSKKVLYTFAYLIHSQDKKSQVDTCATAYIAKLTDPSFVQKELPLALKFDKKKYTKKGLQTCEELTLEKNDITGTQESIFFNNYPFCDGSPDQSHLYDAKAKTCRMQDKQKRIVSSPGLIVRVEGQFEKPPDAACAARTMDSWVLVVHEYQQALTELCPAADIIAVNVGAHPLYDKKTMPNVKEFGVKVDLYHNNHLMKVAEMTACIDKWNKLFGDQAKMKKDYSKLFSAKADFDNKCPKWTSTKIRLTDYTPRPRSCTPIIPSDLDKTDNNFCITRFNCAGSAKYNCLKTLSEYLYQMYLAIPGRDVLKPKEPICSTLDEFKRCAEEPDKRCDEAQTKAILAAMEIHLDKARYTCVDRRGYLLANNLLGKSTYNCPGGDTGLRFGLNKMRQLSLNGIIVDKDKCSVGKDNILEMGSTNGCAIWATVAGLRDMGFYSRVAATTCTPEYRSRRYLGQCDVIAMSHALYDITKNMFQVGKKQMKAEDMCKNLNELMDQAYYALLGCEYRSMLDALQFVQNTFKAAIAECGKINVKPNCNMNSIDEGTTQLINSVKGLKQDKTKCSAITKQTFAVVKLAGSCGQQTKPAVLAAVQGHASQASTICATQLADDCRADPGILCLRDLMADTNDALTDPSGESKYCKDVKAKKLTDCLAKIAGACKSLKNVVSMATKLQALLRKQSDEGCKGGSAEAKLKQPFKCDSRSGVEWMNRFSGRIMNFYLTEKDDTKICGYLHEVYKFGAAIMNYCNDPLIDLLRKVYLNLSGLTKTKCQAEQALEVDRGAAIMVNYLTRPGDVTEGSKTSQLRPLVDTYPVALCMDMKNCQITVEIAVSNKKPPLSHTSQKPLVQVVFVETAKDKDPLKPEEVCGYFPLTKPFKPEVSYQASLDNFVDGEQERDLEVFYKQTVGGKVVAWRKAQKYTVKVEDSDKLGLCKLVGDPYVTTFDGSKYEVQSSGIYTMYVSKDGWSTVQVITYPCNHKKGLCACAVAVKSGDDVIVLDRCKRPTDKKVKQFDSSKEVKSDTQSDSELGPLKVDVYLNGKLEGTEITMLENYKVIGVALPLLTFVKVVNTEVDIDVYVMASYFDTGKTDGLCGTFTGKPDDDFRLADGKMFTGDKTKPDAFIKSWSVDSKKSIFKGVAASKAKPPVPPNSQYHQCVCVKGAQKCDKNLIVQAGPMVLGPNASSITAALSKQPKPKTSVLDHIATIVDAKFKQPTLTWPSGWTDQKAKDECIKLSTKSTFTASCKQVIKIDDTMKKCQTQAKKSGQSSALLYPLLWYQEECQYRSNVDTTIKTDVLTKLREGLCSNDCTGKGKCTQGACKCEPGYSNADCYGRPSTKITLDTMENRGICDTKTSPCKTVRIYGRGFTGDKDKLKCVLEEIEVTAIIKRSGKFANVAGKLGKFDEVICTLPKARSYLIGISNEGGVKTKQAARPVSLMVPFVVHDSSKIKCDPNTVTCKTEDKCIPSVNFQTMKKFFDQMMSELMSDAAKFKVTCGTAAASKAASIKDTQACTKPQRDIMGGFYDNAQKNLLTACPLTDQLTEKPIDPSSCKSGVALKCSQDAVNNLHTKNVENSALSKDEFCSALGGAASCMQSNGGSCSALTKGKLALSYDYIKSIQHNTKCPNVKDPDWKRITDKDKCALSNNYDWLQRMSRQMLDLKPNLPADWAGVCGNEANAAAAASFSTKLCTKPVTDKLKELHNSAVKPQFKNNCPASPKPDPSDPSSCKTNLPRTGKCLSDPATGIIDVASGRNTKDKAALCGNLLNYEKCAKDSAYSCTLATKNAVADDIKMARDLAGKNECDKTPVVWPKPKPEGTAGKFEYDPKSLDLTEGEPAKDLNVRYKGDPKDLITDEEKKNGCFIVVEPALTGKDKIDATQGKAIPQFKFHWKGKPEDLYCKDGTCGVKINEANGWKAKLPFTAALDRMIDGPENRNVILRYKKICDDKVRAVEEIGRTKVNINNGFKKNVCKSIGGPYVKTFDGKEVNNFNQGHQTLYEYKDGQHLQKVETVQNQDSASQATCTCAVSVQSGDDVYVVNRCPRKQTNIPQSRAVTTKLYKNGQLTPGTKIFSHQDGNSYKVVLPTGTSVDINVAGKCMSVYIRPSPHDFKKSSGLCGYHDDDSKNDFKLKDGITEANTDKQPPKFIKDNVVKTEDSIINGVKPIEPEPSKLTYCNNLAQKGSPTKLENIQPQCKNDNVNTDLDNWDKNLKDITKSEESKSSKTNVVNNKVVPGTDAVDVPPKLPPLPKKVDLPPAEKQKIEEECKKKIEEDKMIKECLKALDKKFDVKDEIQACVLSVASTKDKNKSYMTDSSLAARSSCTSTVPTNPGTKDPKSVSNVSCPKNCLEPQGTCKTVKARRKRQAVQPTSTEKAKCDCAQGFSGYDCAIKAGETPKITSIAQNGACDKRVGKCDNIPLTVTGTDFNEKDKHECKLEEIKVSDKPFEKTGRVVTVPAVVRAKRQLDCQTGPNNGSYLVTPLVNGKPKVGSKPLVKYDGLCQTVNVEKITLVPKLPKNYCSFGGVCLAGGEKLQPDNCMMCEAKTWQLVPNKDAKSCSVAGAVLPGTAWAAVTALPWWLIALLTFLLFMLLLLILFLLLWCCCIPCCPCLFAGCLSCRGCCLPGAFCGFCAPCCGACMDGAVCASGGACGCCAPCWCCAGGGAKAVTSSTLTSSETIVTSSAAAGKSAGGCYGLCLCCMGGGKKSKKEKLIYTEQSVQGLDNQAYIHESRYSGTQTHPLIIPFYQHTAGYRGLDSHVTNITNVKNYENFEMQGRSAATQSGSTDNTLNIRNIRNIRNYSNYYADSSLSRNLDRQSDVTTDNNIDTKKITTITTRTYSDPVYGALHVDHSSTIQGIRGLRFGREFDAEQVRGNVEHIGHQEYKHDPGMEVIQGQKVYTVHCDVPVHHRKIIKHSALRRSSSSSEGSLNRAGLYHSSVRFNVRGRSPGPARRVDLRRHESTTSDSEIETRRVRKTNTAIMYAESSSSEDSDSEEHKRRTTIITKKTLLGALVPESLVRAASPGRKVENPIYDDTDSGSSYATRTRTTVTKTIRDEPIRSTTMHVTEGSVMNLDLGPRTTHVPAPRKTSVRIGDVYRGTHGLSEFYPGLGNGAKEKIETSRSSEASPDLDRNQRRNGTHHDEYTSLAAASTRGRNEYATRSAEHHTTRVSSTQTTGTHSGRDTEYETRNISTPNASTTKTEYNTAHREYSTNPDTAPGTPHSGAWKRSDQLYFLSRDEISRYNIDPDNIIEYVYETRNEVESDVAEDRKVVESKKRHRRAQHRTNRL